VTEVTLPHAIEPAYLCHLVKPVRSTFVISEKPSTLRKDKRRADRSLRDDKRRSNHKYKHDMRDKAILGMASMLLVMLLCQHLNAQQTPLHQYAVNRNAWLMYFGDHKFSDRLGVHLEAQFRRYDRGASPQQLLLRTGLNYHFSPQVFATVGYCFVETYPYGDQPVRATFPEHRLWEQIQIKSQAGPFEWVNRLRLEQRFSQLPVSDDGGVYEPRDAVYTNRARILNRFSIPFRGKTIEDKSLYATVYDEVFINFGKNVAANFFDQNRLYAAIGYRIPKVGRLEIGYMYQTIHKADGIKIEQNHTLQVGLSSTLDFYKKTTK
jgi:hypothetical protein